jgi:hypothetical protein
MGTSSCTTVLRQLLFATLAVVAANQGVAAHAAEPKSEPAKHAKLLTITLDTSKSPEIAKWADEAKTRCEKFYPTILAQLAGPNSRQPVAVTITFRKGRGVAATGGNHIMCNTDWFTEHPDDYGAIIHEMCHVVQAYGGRPVPSWVTEGIADYVRWFKFEPADRHPRPNPDHAKYTDSYQTTAAFFDWIVRTKNKAFIQRLNAAARSGKYSDDIFRQYAKKPLDELWAEYIDSLKSN